MAVIELSSKVLAKQNGWSRVYAEGYAAGEATRRRGETLQRYAMVGIDEWALGFRAAYFERQDLNLARGFAPPAVVRSAAGIGP
jgi:hypothetical protein